MTVRNHAVPKDCRGTKYRGINKMKTPLTVEQRKQWTYLLNRTFSKLRHHSPLDATEKSVELWLKKYEQLMKEKLNILSKI